MKLQHFRQAYADFTRCIVLDSTDLDVFYDRALAASELGYFIEAQKDLDYIIERNSIDSDTYYMKAHLYEKTGNWNNSLQFVDSALKYDDNQDYYLLKGRLYLRQNAYIKALDNYTKAFERWPYQNRFLFLKGYANYLAEDYQSSFQDFRSYVKQESQDGEGHFYYGKVCEVLGKSKLAQRHLELASILGYNPEDLSKPDN